MNKNIRLPVRKSDIGKTLCHSKNLHTKIHQPMFVNDRSFDASASCVCFMGSRIQNKNAINFFQIFSTEEFYLSEQRNS